MSERQVGKSWTLSDEFWEKVKDEIPAPKGRDPHKQYRHRPGQGRKRMNDNVRALMERFYKVPERTANEVKLYEQASALRHGMTEPQAVTLDALLETCVDCIGDAAEDGFEQGFSAGLELANENYR